MALRDVALTVGSNDSCGRACQTLAESEVKGTAI
jgi:hypothetical protein